MDKFLPNLVIVKTLSVCVSKTLRTTVSETVVPLVPLQVMV
ncbi:MAG: hypothetical protein WC422_02725 [Candidatus Paceibacterota bacterium]